MKTLDAASRPNMVIADQKQPENKVSRIVMIGVGNQFRRDDGVGLYVARRVQEETDDVEVAFVGDDGTAMIEAWQGADVAVLCDAVVSGAGPGTIYCFDVSSQPLPRSLFNISTHVFNVSETIELARTLGQLPPRLLVYGIEAADVDFGEGLSAEVEPAAEYVVQTVLSLERVAGS